VHLPKRFDQDHEINAGHMQKGTLRYGPEATASCHSRK